MGALKPESTLREHSRFGYTLSCEYATIEETNCGSLQRIADACELMAKNHEKLQADLDWYKTEYRKELEYCNVLKRQLSRAKGEITKLKKRMGK